MATKVFQRFLVFLILISFACFSPSYAQNKVEQYNSNGLSTTIFTTSKGKITVYFPEYLPGETIAGTIQISAFGTTSKKRQKNEESLKLFKISLAGTSFSLSNSAISFKAPNTSKSNLVLQNEKGKRLLQSVLNSRLEESTVPNVPEYMVAGSATKIYGNCDGDLSNNSLQIGNSTIPVLAESESALLFKPPENINVGQSQITYTNNNQTIETSIHVLGLDLSVGNNNLSRGQRTTLHITISGLEGLETTVPLTITNQSPANISLQGGAEQSIIINPSTDTISGFYVNNLEITALQSGGFSITVNVEPPQTSAVALEDQELCNCYLNGDTHLIPPEVCQELGGSCNQEGEIEVIDDIDTPIISCVFPDEIIAGDNSITLQVIDVKENCLAAIFSYRHFDDTEWQFIGSDNDASDGLSFLWSPPLGNDGVNVIRAKVVNTNNQITQFEQSIFLNVSPEQLNPPNITISYTISLEEIERARERARATGDRIKEQKDKINDLENDVLEAEERKKKFEALKNKLMTIDEVLDNVPKVYKDSLRILVDSLERLRKQLPDKIDKAALQKAVDDAQKRVDDCNKRLEELKKEQSDLEKERDNLKEQLDETLEEIHDLFIKNGWTGNYGYHSDGRPHYGYVGDERSNTDIIYDEIPALRKKLRALKKDYLKTLRRLEKLPAEIDEAQEECDKLNQKLQKAKEAQEKGDQYMATEVAVDDLCRQIRSLLKPLWRWCINNPDHCYFKERLRKLFEECPKDSAELEAFWKDFNDLLNAKKEQEEAFGKNADGEQDTIDKLENEIENEEARLKALKEQQDREFAEAERKRKQRLKQIADAKKRQQEAEKRKREQEKKKIPKPEPILDEPIEADDDQIKLYANSWVFKILHQKYVMNPCSCEAKALKLANNTNTIAQDIVGRIGVGVAFAPLEAFPGISLGGRLGIGAVKALCSNLFGGQSFSEELTKNLFSVIGGEIFPKLVGNDFTGNRLNDLAGKGLEEIFKAEGIRTISWEGKTKTRDCGEIKGKTTMLVNPNTGWVTVLIKVEGCPLVVVKYKMNNDGIRIKGTVSIQTVRG